MKDFARVNNMNVKTDSLKTKIIGYACGFGIFGLFVLVGSLDFIARRPI